FLDTHAGPQQVEKWRKAGIVDREVWQAAGAAGLLGLSTAAAYGGAGGDFRHEIILMEEMSRRGVEGWGVSLHNAIILPYIETFGSEEQKKKWLPRLASGELVSAIAMTEPSAGSDLQGVRTTARRTGNQYTINGAKTFISNGQTANFIVVVAKTDPSQAAKGISLIAVETDEVEGFQRGRNLDKVGLEAADTSELFFNDVKVPTANLIGAEEGRGFYQLMEKLPQERMVIAVQCMAMIERALTVTRDYVNHCIEQLLARKLDNATASMAKYWVSELQGKIVDACLQLHGGYGYMDEYPIARMYKDARVSCIYGGTTEIMKLLIARTL